MVLKENERNILLEYAKWYDSYLATPEELVKEFEENRNKEQKEKEKQYESFSLKI